MLTPHEFKRTRAARPRPDLGGDDLADLGTTCWYVGRFSTDKHLSIGKAHAVRPKTGLYWPPVVGPCGPPSVAVSVWLAVLVAASTGRRCGRPPWWRPSVVGWCAGWRSLPLVSVRRAGGRSVAGVRPWPWWPFSWPLAAFRPSAGPLVRRGPFVARGGPFSGLASGGPSRPVAGWCACLVSTGIGPPTSGRPVAGRWSVLAVPCTLGVAGLAVGAGWPSGWPVLIRAARGPCWLAVLIRPPSVALSASLVLGPWRPLLGRVAAFRAVGGVLVPCGPFVARVGLVLGLADWLAVWALPVAGGWCPSVGPCGPCWARCPCLACGVLSSFFNERAARGWAVLLVRAGWPCYWLAGRCPCWWSLLVSLQRLAVGRPSIKGPNTSGRRGGLAGGVGGGYSAAVVSLL